MRAMAKSGSIEAEIEHLVELVYASLCQSIKFAEQAQSRAYTLSNIAANEGLVHLMNKAQLLMDVVGLVEGFLKQLTIFIENTLRDNKPPCWE